MVNTLIRNSRYAHIAVKTCKKQKIHVGIIYLHGFFIEIVKMFSTLIINLQPNITSLNNYNMIGASHA